MRSLPQNSVAHSPGTSGSISPRVHAHHVCATAANLAPGRCVVLADCNNRVRSRNQWQADKSAKKKNTPSTNLRNMSSTNMSSTKPTLVRRRPVSTRKSNPSCPTWARGRAAANPDHKSFGPAGHSKQWASEITSLSERAFARTPSRTVRLPGVVDARGASRTQSVLARDRDRCQGARRRAGHGRDRINARYRAADPRSPCQRRAHVISQECLRVGRRCNMRCRRVRFTRTKRVGYCWIGRCLIICGSAENRGNSCHLSDQPTPAQASLLRTSS